LTKDEALKLALETLQFYASVCNEDDQLTPAKTAIAKCKAALAQPAQEPYDQTALELCNVCGWKTLIPDDGCLNCERAQPAQEPVGWQSIETAPKDGTGVLVYCQKSLTVTVTGGYWDDHPQCRCWIAGGYMQKVFPPTHWMPLPPSPDETLAQEPTAIAALVEGMEVSIDVSTGEHDSGNRLFGTVTRAQENQGSKHSLVLLVQDPTPNFKPAPLPVQPAQEPVAYVTGVYGGRFTYAPLNPAMVLPIGMALYSSPQGNT